MRGDAIYGPRPAQGGRRQGGVQSRGPAPTAPPAAQSFELGDTEAMPTRCNCALEAARIRAKAELRGSSRPKPPGGGRRAGSLAAVVSACGSIGMEREAAMPSLRRAWPRGSLGGSGRRNAKAEEPPPLRSASCLAPLAASPRGPGRAAADDGGGNAERSEEEKLLDMPLICATSVMKPFRTFVCVSILALVLRTSLRNSSSGSSSVLP
mmetsp:Transcript_3810/g.10456  ORF Transcript_3810/g.10456 Transcript_3810/m.10456 type:complete len:209 (+) Transcript_3810:33-659(+)